MSRRMSALAVGARVVALATARLPPNPVGARRIVRVFERTLRLAPGVVASRIELAGVSVLHLSAGSAAGGTVLHVHGGAYTSGSPRMAYALSGLVRQRGPDLVSVDYRLAPEHPFPAGLDDVLRVYAHLVSTVGSDRVVIAGESSGGGLALALLLRARDEGLPLPAGIALSFPWADLTLSGESCTTNDGKDLLSRSGLAASAAMYTGPEDVSDPYASPLFGSFSSFPDTLIVVGQLDLLLDDSRRLAEKMSAAGVAVELLEWPNSTHGFTGLPAPEGRAAALRLREFILGRLSGG